MCGHAADDSDAQLALMDAVIFFSVAVLISAAMLSYANRGNERVAFEFLVGQADPQEIMSRFLAASLGSNTTLGGESNVCVRGQTQIRDCIVTEAMALANGEPADVFSSLNDLLCKALRSCCPAVCNPYLLVVRTSFSEPLLALPGLPEQASQRYACCTNVTAQGDEPLLVVLLLCPAAPSELHEI